LKLLSVVDAGVVDDGLSVVDGGVVDGGEVIVSAAGSEELPLSRLGVLVAAARIRAVHRARTVASPASMMVAPPQPASTL
jgi:hypothetical protein